MHQLTWKPVVLALAAISLTAMVPLTVFAQDRPDDHHDQNAQEHRDDHHDDNRADPAAQYRHDHPHSSARCHDGFFTSTKDRGRACSKHGGIDVWLAP
jgi:ABC-type Zn2+ transport system substrate-binding protein/surface adhesin